MHIERTVKELILKHAGAHGLDPAIVYGVIKKEPSGNQYAIRYEPNWRWFVRDPKGQPFDCTDETERKLQAFSWGLMQMMGSVFRELGYEGWLSEIPLYADIQLHYGCAFLAKKIKAYGLRNGLSAYNAGSPIEANQESYVDKVLEFSKEWQRMRIRC